MPKDVSEVLRNREAQSIGVSRVDYFRICRVCASAGEVRTGNRTTAGARNAVIENRSSGCRRRALCPRSRRRTELPRRDFRLILFSSFTANCQGQVRMPEEGFFKLERALTPRAYILTAFPKPRDSAQRRSSGGTFVGGNSTS